MSVKLSPQQHDQIFSILKRSFSDFALFDSLVAVKLRQALVDSNSIEINEKSTKRVVERYFAVDAFKSPEQKALIYPLELIFQACYVLVISHRESSRASQWKDVDTLLRHYPQFARDVEPEELQYLLNYRNVVKIALSIIPARLNKGRLLQIGGKLEGSNNEYITGSGQKIEVIRRTDIYHQEGKVKIVLKKPRVRAIPAQPAPVFSDPSMSPSVVTSDDESVSQPFPQAEKKKRKRNTTVITCTSSSFSHTKLKMMKLPVEDIDTLLHGRCQPAGHRAFNQQSSAVPASVQSEMRKSAPFIPRSTSSSSSLSRSGSSSSLLSLQSLIDLPESNTHRVQPAVSYLDAATIRVADAYFGGDSDFYPSSFYPGQTQTQNTSAPCVPYLTRDTTFDLMMNSGMLSNASEFWGLDDDLSEPPVSSSNVEVIPHYPVAPPSVPTLSRAPSSLSLMDLSALDEEQLLFGEHLDSVQRDDDHSFSLHFNAVDVC